MHTYTPANSISDGPITNILSILSVLVAVLSRAHAKGGKALTVSDLALLLVVFRVTLRQASMAAKGLSLPEILRPSGHLPAFGGRPAGRVSHFPSASQRSSAPVTLQRNLVIKMKALKKMIYSGLRERERERESCLLYTSPSPRDGV